MTMPELVYSHLSSDTVLASVVQDRIYAAGTLGVDNIPAEPDYPYVMLNWGEAPQYRVVRETSRVLAHSLRVYVYDTRGSFVRINNIHRMIRDTVEGLGGQVSPSGRRCTAAEFATLGGEDTIAERNENVRVATYTITGPQ